MGCPMSTQLPTKPPKPFQYANRLLGRTADVIKELHHTTLELEILLHDLAKLFLSVAFNVLIILTILHVILLVAHFLFH